MGESNDAGESADLGAQAPKKQWISRMPDWVLALLLIAPFWLAHHVALAIGAAESSARMAADITGFLMIAVMFMPAAVRRRDWREVFVMAVVSLGWIALRSHINLRPFYPPYSVVLSSVVPVGVIGIMEWLLRRPRSAEALLWIVMLSAAVAFVVPLVEQPVDFAGWEIRLPTIAGNQTITTWSKMIHIPLLGILAWIAIPAALKAGWRWPARIGAAGSVLVAVGAFLVFFDVVAYRIAEKSLTDGKPFDRNWSIGILASRSGPTDRRALLRVIDSADWTRREPDEWDYVSNCIEALWRRDGVEVADHLAAHLHHSPSEALAVQSARVLASQRRYDAVPILLRYALIGNGTCSWAVEQMRVPQAALAIIRESAALAIISEAAADRPAPSTRDFPVSVEHRRKLIALLGKDAGPNLHDWFNFYDTELDRVPTPLTSTEVAETRRVASAIATYWRASNRLETARTRLARRRLEKDGQSELLKRIDRYEPLLRGQRRPNDADAAGIDPSDISTLEDYMQRVRRDMAVAAPDWNVAGTDALEREVQAYGRRVTEICRRFDVAVTPPTTDPSGR